MKNLDKSNMKKFLIDNAVVILIILSAIAVSIVKPNFISAYNIKNLLANISMRFIIALGIAGVLIMRNNDLSAGRQVGLAACLAGIFVQKADFGARVYPGLPQLNMWLVLIMLMVGFALTFGVINGLVVSKLHVPAFIGTYGMQTVIYGICMIVSKNASIGQLDSKFTDWGNGSFFGLSFLPNLAIVALIAMGVMYTLFNHTSYGKKMYAIGGNPNSAEVSGINVSKMIITSYMIASAYFALGGFVLAAKTGNANSGMGLSYELFAIASCTIGGVSVSGGIGTVPGVLVGVTVFELLKIEMNFLGINAAWTYIVQGIVIVIAIALDIRKYVAKK